MSSSEDGSVLLLTLGYAVLAVSLVFVCVCATDLYTAQKRLDALADAAALAGADGFTVTVVGDVPTAELTDAGIRQQVDTLLAATGGEATLVSAATPDGVSSRVTITTDWHPPLVSFAVPDGVRLEATGTSRTALR